MILSICHIHHSSYTCASHLAVIFIAHIHISFSRVHPHLISFIFCPKEMYLTFFVQFERPYVTNPVVLRLDSPTFKQRATTEPSNDVDSVFH